MKLLVQGASEISDVPGLAAATEGLTVAVAEDAAALARELPGTQILLGWDFRGRELAECWQHADSLQWIHWAGAGVDALLFPELTDSDVILTNARGLYDRPMAEYVLGYMLSEVKLFRKTFEQQAHSEWDYQLTGKLAGKRALVFGVGSIGYEIGRLLRAVGVAVSGVGRTARPGDDCFDDIHAADDAAGAVGEFDWVIGVMPGTPATDRYFSTEIFAAMKPTARFINVGRGRSVDEVALLAALEDKTIAGAMLDVFQTEPLPADSPLWRAPNLMVSPHMSGDFREHLIESAQIFVRNLKCYMAGEPLQNRVDKKLGFVAQPPQSAASRPGGGTS